MKYIAVTDEEAAAIRWHMGLSDTDYATRQSLFNAMKRFPLALALHMADQVAVYF